MSTILFILNSIILRFKRNRKIKGVEVSKVNLGCGMTVRPGWFNVDGSLNSLVSKMPITIIKIAFIFTGAKNTFSLDEYIRILLNHEFIHHDLRFGLPFSENCVSYIYTSHFLEHLLPKEMELVILDSYKVLKPGGVIRISVPDLEYAISLYPDKKEEMLDKYFFINNVNNNFSNHKYMYDFGSMAQILRKMGFKNITREEFGSADFPDVSFLDNRMKDSLIIQAVK